MWAKLLDAVPRDEAKKAATAFDQDPRDTSTPDGMTALLGRIWLHDREVMKPESADLLLDIMRRCQTGQARLKGILPEGTEVAHKTGSIGGTTNDVGIVTLPDNTGHVAIAVFVKASDKPVAERERAIAEIARTAHDFFLYETSAGALDYDHMAARIVDALKPAPRERVMFGADPDYFQEVTDALRKKLKEAGAVEGHDLNSAHIYLWLALSKRKISPGERQGIAAWLDRGGTRRESHFHWGEGSVDPDGLAGTHTAALDRNPSVEGRQSAGDVMPVFFHLKSGCFCRRRPLSESPQRRGGGENKKRGRRGPRKPPVTFSESALPCVSTRCRHGHEPQPVPPANIGDAAQGATGVVKDAAGRVENQKAQALGTCG